MKAYAESQPQGVHAIHAWLGRFGFRFAVIYIFLFLFPFPFGSMHVFGEPNWATVPWGKLWQAIVPWVGQHVLGRSDAFTNPSFANEDSDSWFQWIQTGCFLVMALGVALVWTRVDVQRKRDPWIHEGMRVCVRYALVAAMLNYGVIKVLRLQMPSPGVALLMTPIGQISPLMLLWTFIGYSPTYQIFAGTMEVVAGLLLLTRRTTTLGSLVTAGVMTNVVMMDLCFDVPVKLGAIHWLLFAGFLAGGDLRRLANLFILNQPTEPMSRIRLWPEGRMAQTAGVLNVLVVTYVIWASCAGPFQRAWEKNKETKHELAGFYEVEVFRSGEEVVPPLLNHPKRWRAVQISNAGGFVAQGMNYQTLLKWRAANITYETIDPTHGRIAMRQAAPAKGENAGPSVMNYTRVGSDRLELSGKLEGTEIAVTLHRLHEKDFPLMQRDFRWIGR